MMLSPDGEMHCLNITVKEIPLRRLWGKNFSVMNGCQSNDLIWSSFPFATFFEGYWTDNGAYYYYQTLGPNITYEDTLIKLNEEFQKLHLPMKYM